MYLSKGDCKGARPVNVQQPVDLTDLIVNLDEFGERFIAFCHRLTKLQRQLADNRDAVFLVSVKPGARIETLEEHVAAVHQETIFGLRHGFEGFEAGELEWEYLVEVLDGHETNEGFSCRRADGSRDDFLELSGGKRP